MAVYELPGAQVAALTTTAPSQVFQAEHTALLTWIEANGYRVAGPYREVYLQQGAGSPAEAATEIQYPVEKG
jgi:effector-binding domain-containing protein